MFISRYTGRTVVQIILSPPPPHQSHILHKTSNVLWHNSEVYCCSIKAVILHIRKVCVCSLGCQAWNTHAPYFHLRHVRLYSIFPRYLIQGMIFEKKSLSRICVFWFSLQNVLYISHSKKNWARYGQKCILVFTYSNRYSCPIPMKHEFSRQILEKYSNTKFHENPSSRSRVVSCGQTDIHDKATSSVS
jgi:hypothetical protein